MEKLKASVVMRVTLETDLLSVSNYNLHNINNVIFTTIGKLYAKIDLDISQFSFRSTQIKTYSWDNAQVILVGNKCDMEDERIVSMERGKQLADQLGMLEQSESFCLALILASPQYILLIMYTLIEIPPRYSHPLRVLNILNQI